MKFGINGTEAMRISAGSTIFKAPDGGSRYLFGGTGNSDNAELSLYNSSDAQKVRIGAGVDSFFTGGSVGIGVAAPFADLTVGTSQTFNNGDNYISAVFQPSISAGESAGMLFGHYPVSGYAKQGIFWERYVGSSGSGGRGNLHFVNRDATDTSVPTIADARMTITADGNVGIATSAPSGAKLDIFTGSTSADGLKINRFGSGVYYSTLRQDTHGLAIHVGDGSSIAERAAITPNGITFNGDTAAANALDDYEEGTWTPVAAGGGSNPTNLSHAIQSGNYVKIGGMVYVSFRCRFSFDSGTGSGTININGLPFTAANHTQPKSTPQHDNISFSGFEYLEMAAGANSTSVNFAKNRSAAGANSLLLSDCNASSTDVNGGFMYFV
jgi:hypothetical protein